MPRESANLVVMRGDTKEVEEKRGEGKKLKPNKNGDEVAMQTR
jgi:hypothetical protein